MASHGFAGFDPDQTQAVITATVSLSKTVEDTLAAATEVFRRNLVSSDKVLGECEYKDEVAAGLVKSLDQMKEDMNIGPAIASFNAKVSEAEQVIGSTFNRNTQNNEEAQANLKAQAKKAGETVSQ